MSDTIEKSELNNLVTMMQEHANLLQELSDAQAHLHSVLVQVGLSYQICFRELDSLRTTHTSARVN